MVGGRALRRDEKSSIDRPWSAPVWSGSDQRSMTSVPLGMLRPVMVNVIAARFAARLPLSAPAAPPVIGPVKSSAATATPALWNSASEPVTVGLPTRYENAIVCAAAALLRHCSPMYEMSSDVIVAPVLFCRRTPQNRLPIAALPEPSEPSARSVAVPVP